MPEVLDSGTPPWHYDADTSLPFHGVLGPTGWCFQTSASSPHRCITTRSESMTANQGSGIHGI